MKTISNELSLREARFVELVTDPLDNRALGAKAEAAGFTDGRIAYRLLRRDRVRQAVECRRTDILAVMRARVASVLEVAYQKAIAGDLRAMRLYLEAFGELNGGGPVVTVTNNVAAPANERTLEQTLEEMRASRLAERGMM